MTSTGSLTPVAVETSEASYELWDDYIAAQPTAHHAQTAAWARAQRATNVSSYIVTSRSPHSSELRGGAVVIVRSLRGAGRVGYIDRGPIVSDDRHRREVIDAIVESVRSQRLNMLILQPADGDFATESALRARGFGSTHIKTSLGATAKLDLSHGDPDLVLSEMKSKTRANVRKALRSPLTFRSSTTADDVDRFHELLTATAERQGFTAPSASFLRRVMDEFGDRGWAQIMLVELEGNAVSGMLAITAGNSLVYKRGAWSGEAPEHRPNERLHWGAMDWAITNAKASYDFDGLERATATHVLSGLDQPTGIPSSVDRFKLGFGGTPELLPEVLTYVPNPLVRVAYQRVFPTLASNKRVKQQIKRIRQR